MKKLYEIKSRWDGRVLFSIETTSMKLAVEAAVKAGTDLSMANLPRVNLSRANLSGSNLSGSNLSGSNLFEANFSMANLSGSNLSGSNLFEANLYGANLYGAKLTDDIEVQKTPIQLCGLRYDVIIWDEHIQIGCEFHSMTDWFSFDDKRILEMDGKDALKFWRQWKEPIRQICIADGRYKMEDAA